MRNYSAQLNMFSLTYSIIQRFWGKGLFFFKKEKNLVEFFLAIHTYHVNLNEQIGLLDLQLQENRIVCGRFKGGMMNKIEVCFLFYFLFFIFILFRSLFFKRGTSQQARFLCSGTQGGVGHQRQTLSTAKIPPFTPVEIFLHIIRLETH